MRVGKYMKVHRLTRRLWVGKQGVMNEGPYLIQKYNLSNSHLDRKL